MGKEYRTLLFLTATTILLTLFANFASTSFARGNNNVAIVYTDGIKPYEVLKDKIRQRLTYKVNVRTFNFAETGSKQGFVGELKAFNPAVTVCIGSNAARLCRKQGIYPLVSAYNPDIRIEQNPLHILLYLKPSSKKVIAFFDGVISQSVRDFFRSLAAGYGLRAKTKKKTMPVSIKELFWENDAAFFGEGILFVNLGKGQYRDGAVVLVVDRSIKTYSRLEQRVIAALPRVDKTINTANWQGGKLAEKVVNSKPGVVICIGANSYQYLKSLQSDCRVVLAVETKSIKDRLDNWGLVSGASIFIDPQEQIKVLSQLTGENLTLAIPYDPDNSELLVLKALLSERKNIDIVTLAALSPKYVMKLTLQAFEDYDGIWVIPDQVLSSKAVQSFILEQSLRRQKILVTMMHPYTKAGAMLAVSSVGRSDKALCGQIVELVNERLANAELPGRILSPRASISLNLRTVKKLNYTVPKALLNRAEFVFGKQ
ncbi:MAG: ABC transporter substrate binding protein [Planctomycetota bacterium]|jgi:ABC-type uncharacterized transport system substrate-binding protein